MRTNEKWEDTREGWMDVGEGGGTNRAKQLPRGGEGGRLSDGGVIMKTTGLKRKGREKKKEKSN